MDGWHDMPSSSPGMDDNNTVTIDRTLKHMITLSTVIPLTRNEHVYTCSLPISCKHYQVMETLESLTRTGIYTTIKETAMDYTTTKATLQKNGTSQSTQELLENEYAVVDMSTGASNFTSPYNQLKREQNSGKHSCQSQAQRTVRLSENKDLGYSTLT